ncbi:PAS domain-containing protein [Natrononativus amylolyticus]|uniref:PAS domain-containing protein n=1 Tax=Natrononativus amylolyticus TaxID=2963434 RepID=UPI0020CE920E|nr:bacterio-opsin activator domain-containing protein [Natrononativus amylolyticus]
MSSGSLTNALRETLALFDGSGIPLTTTEAADRLDLGRRSTYERLERLVEHGELETKKAGASARIWWRAPRDRRRNGSRGDDPRTAPADDPPLEFPSGGETGARIREMDWSETPLGPTADWPQSLRTAVDMVVSTEFPTVLAWGSDLTCIYNDAYDRLLGENSEALGRPFHEVWLSADGGDSPVERALAGEAVRFDTVSVTLAHRDEPEEAYFDISAVPVRDEAGSVVGVRTTAIETTERVRVEGELRESEERLRLALEAGEIGAWELDLRTEASPVRSPQHDRIFGYEEPIDDWSFERFLEHVHPDDRERVEGSFEAAFQSGDWSFECRIVRTDGVQRWIEARGEFYFDDEGEPVRAVGNVQDVTARKDRERALEESRRQYQTLIDNYPNGAVALVDEECRYVSFGGRLEGDTDVPRAELEGERVRDVLPPEIEDVVAPRYEAALDGEPSTFEDTIDDRVYQFHFVPVRDDDGDVFAATAMSQDVTRRKEREKLLWETKSQLEAATEAGAVGTWEWHIPEDRFVAGASFARMFGVDPEAARTGVPIDRFVSAIHEDDRERVERSVESVVATGGEYREEYRVWNADGNVRWVVARGSVECDDDGNPVTFPGALVDITERKRAEKELERHRNQLEALNSLHEVVRDITDAVIEQSSREEIEETVCERLAASDSYEFAWIGDVDVQSQAITLRAEAAVDGTLNDATIPVNRDGEWHREPVERAISRREMQVARDLEFDHDSGSASTAAIPVVYEDTLYGVLAVYADRPNAFTDDERSVIGQLGEIIGHAIAAIERQRALMSDEVIELEFTIGDFFGAIHGLEAVDGTITHDRAVPAGDGVFLEYGTATEDAMAAIETLVDAESVPHWESVHALRIDGDATHFELRLVDPPMFSTITAYGGSIDEARIEDGDYYMRLHLPPSTNVRRIVDSITETYPRIELVSQRQVDRDRKPATGPQSAFFERLTDRQRAALEAAYYAGYFAWPRDTNGEEVADSLGISAATYHQHLRSAQRKLLRVALDDRGSD